MSRELTTEYLSRIDYQEAWELQKGIVAAIDQGSQGDTLLMLEHPPTYTIGTDKHPEHLLYGEEELKRRGIQVYQIDRGGDITYHGPGQLVGYPLIYLASEGLDLHAYLRTLEEAIIGLLAEYGIEGGRKPEYTGVWVGDRKIAAIGVKFNRARNSRGFVTSHGFAFNVKKEVEQEGFQGIIPCGISEYGVTSLESLTGLTLEVERIGQQLLPHVVRVFGYDSAVTSEIRSRLAPQKR